MNLTDTHTHLFADEFDADRKEVIERAISSGVTKLFLPNIDSSSSDKMLALAAQFPENCFPMMGLHPCSVKENSERELDRVKDFLFQKKDLKFYGVGEIGIDLYWDKTFIEEQKDAFKTQVKWAKELNLPVIIHTRDSFDIAFEIIEGLNDGGLKGIFHCFSGTVEEAEKVISLGGFKMGIGGVLTFKNSGLDKMVSEIGLEHLVLETDSPYLAPVPYRGKRNESAYLTIIAEKIAEIKKISIQEVASVTTDNAKKIFSI